ncbi:hypothetical protein RDABS01_015590 [Bienertia sinuspersici]
MKTAHNASVLKALPSKMEHILSKTMKRAKRLMTDLSSTDRTRTSIFKGLGKKLKEKMEEFHVLRANTNEDYKEIIQMRYLTVTRENPNEKTFDLLISTGENETFLQKAIQ